MTTYYWVGGTGTWNNSSTTNWSTSSGGASGSGPPTSTDDVIFDSSSYTVNANYTVTCSTGWVCRDLTMGGPSSGKNIIWAGSTSGSIYGSMNLSGGSAHITRTYFGTITFAATSTGKTITCNGVTFASSFIINGVGGGWTQTDAFSSSSGTWTLANGNYDTGGFSHTAPVHNCTAANSQTLTLGASTMNSHGWNMTSTNMTFSGASSTISLTGLIPSFQGGGRTYGTVTQAGTGTLYFSGANTYATLTLAPASGVALYYLNGTQTVTGAFTANGSSISSRLLILSGDSAGVSTAGVQRTIAASGATVTLSNADFQDIAATGGSAGWGTGTSIGNGGNNSGITFTTPVTRYAVVAGNWTSTAVWSATSGGAGGATAPLAQDTVILDASSAAGTYTQIAYMFAGTNITCTGFTRTLSDAGARILGNITLASGMTVSPGVSTSGFLMVGRSAQTITSAGKTFGVTVDTGAGVAVTLADALLCSNILTLTSGTLDDNGQTVTAAGFSSASGNTRDIKCSTTWSVTGGGQWITSNSTGLTYSVNSGVISFVGAGSRLSITNAPGAATMPKILVASGSYTLTLTDVVSKGIDFTGSTVTCAATTYTTKGGNITLATGGTYTFFVPIFGATSGTDSLTSNGKTISGITVDGVGGTASLADAAVLSGVLTVTKGTFTDNGQTLTLDTFSSSNSNTRDIKCSTTWSVTGTGASMWSSDTNTGLTYSVNSGTISLTTNSATGRTITTGASAPLMPKILAAVGSYTLTLTNVNCKGLDFTGSTVTCGSAPKVAGALTLATGGTYTSFTPTMSGTSGTQSITSSGKTISTLTVDGVGGTASLVDAMTCSDLATITNGSFTSNGQSFTALGISSNNSNTRALTATGSETWTMTGTTTAWNTSTMTGCTATMGTSLVTFSGLSPTINASTFAFYNITASTGITTLSSGCRATGTGTFGGTALNVRGDWNVATISGLTSLTTFSTAGASITSNGQSFAAVEINGAFTYTLQDAFVCTGTLTLTRGTIALNGFNLTAPSLTNTGASTRAITFGASETFSLTSTGTVWNTTGANFSITPATGTIKFTNVSATSKTFAGLSLTYGTLWFSGAGTGDNIITGANTFASIKTDGTLAVKTITLPAATTTTLSAASLDINGNATYTTIFRSSSADSAATLSCASGNITLNYVSIKDSTPTGGAAFWAPIHGGCVNVSGNIATGWWFLNNKFMHWLYF